MILLSHRLSINTPAYGGGESLQIKPITEISKGDTANTVRLIFSNHIGTHIDFPSHFFPNGKNSSDYSIDEFVFHAPVLVDIPYIDGLLIKPEHVGKLQDNNDLLLIRTDSELFRHEMKYWQHNPGLSEELSFWLRKEYPNLRAIGIDCISITSRDHREEGRKSHHAFLNPDGLNDPILLIEDMSLVNAKENLLTVIVAPLFIEGICGIPCSVFGFIHKAL